jgi:hypothetical protein
MDKRVNIIKLGEINEVTRMQNLHIFRFLLLFLVCTFLAGCAAKVPGGKWEVDLSVQQAFESGTVFPDHTYYYLGSVSAPGSIIAINNRIALRTRVWAQVEMNEEILNGWLNWYRTEKTTGCEYYGGVILTPDGQQAGLWYSQNIINIIRMPEPGVIEVYQPHSISGATCGAAYDGIFTHGMR